MKMQFMSKRLGVVTVGFAMLSAVGMAQAQTAGSNVISVGWLHAAPQNQSTPLTVNSINGMPVNLVETGSGFAAEKTDTLGFTFAHYFTDDISVEAVAGYPNYLKFEGTGTLSSFGVLGKAKPIAPIILLRYHFFDAQTKFRPYVGLGVNYTKFIDAQVSNNDFVTSKIGPGGSATVHATSSWSPAFSAGANYAIDDHWSVGLSVSYVPVKTTATLTGTTVGGTVIDSTATLKIRPVITFLNVGYRF